MALAEQLRAYREWQARAVDANREGQTAQAYYAPSRGGYLDIVGNVIPAEFMSKLTYDAGDNESYKPGYWYNTQALAQHRLGPQPVITDADGKQISLQEGLKTALANGEDLRGVYGTTYNDAVQFKRDLGQYTGKDTSMIIPANPVGYKGDFQFDPNFGSTYYRDLATQAGKALGLSDQQILQKGTEYFADKFASGPQTKGIIGFTDFGSGLMDSFALTAGVPADQLDTLRGTALKPLYDASTSVFNGLNGAAKIESQSSGFFKGIGESFSKLGPIGTLALATVLGPAAGALAGSLGGGAALATGLAAGGAAALPQVLQGNFSDALKSGLAGGALAGIGAGGLSGIGKSVSDWAGGGTLGNVASGAATGSIAGGLGSLITGNDLGAGILGGAASGGIGAGINSLLNSATTGAPDLGTGLKTDGTMSLGDPNSFINAGATPSTGGQGMYIDPTTFAPGVGANLPNTTGVLNSVGGIGDLFSGVNFPQQGVTPGVTNSDFGSGVGQGLTPPTSPTLDGQLGQGLTVGTPSGVLGQGGVTPTGQVNLGDPNSFINTGEISPSTPQAQDPNMSKLLKALLGAGATAGLAKGLGGLLDNSGGAAPPTDTGRQTAAPPLQRELGFQFQAPEYTSGLNGALLQTPDYQVINPQMRGFAEGGLAQSLDQGMGSLPMQGRFLQGAGDGMSDSIPAVLGGQEPIKVTDGEYIVPAHAVSSLGNGSSQAGARRLDAMVQNIYQQTGRQTPPQKINPATVQV